MPQVPQTNGWNKLWRLRLPHKFKIFLWRFCRNTIPVRNMLRSKGVVVPILCPFYRSDVEHMLHIFFDCDFVVRCWQLIGLELDLWNEEYAASWLLKKLATDTHDNVIKLATVLWGILLARNKHVLDDRIITPNLAVEWSTKYITAWRDAVKHSNHVKPVNGSGDDFISAVKWVARR